MVRPKAEEKRGSIYRVAETNRPSVLSLLGLVEVLEKKRGDRNRGEPSVLVPKRAFGDMVKKG